jgi:photosystem II stability/assembly factor-like uncharacterized protein
MRVKHAGMLAAAFAVGLLAVAGASRLGSGDEQHAAAARPAAVAAATPGESVGSAAGWDARTQKGSVRLEGQVPRAVAERTTHAIQQHAPAAELTLRFAFPLRDKAGLDSLIAEQAKTHRYLTRPQLYARFSPPQAQVNALRHWLVGNGFKVTHVGADRLALTASAPTTTVEKVLHTKIDDYVRPASTFKGIDVKPYVYYSNRTAPVVPARLGLQSISGLSNIDRFFTSAQIYAAQHPGACGDEDNPDDNAVINPLCVDVRGGGYFPTDLRGLYDVNGHGFDATGQTIGFTLWTVPERQAAMNKFATDTGDQLITVDPSCVATGNSPTTPSSCSTATVAPNHLMFILENGNSDTLSNFGSNVETALDIEAAHGVATGVAMKYYASECSSTPPPNTGLANAGCNGSDVGMEMAMEDAANDPTLHSVSNSWGYGGEAEWGATDPFVVSTQNILALAAAAGTSFYFSTGDAGTYQSGYPTDSPYVVSVGGTSTYSTSAPGTWSASTTWSGAGSWCSTVYARPSWQTAAGLSSASCPGRVSPDIAAVGDPNTGVRFTSSTNLTGGTQSGQVGGTSLSAPVLNGLQAVTQNFIAAQTYPGPKPKMGFVSPVLYQLGNSPNYQSYFRDIECGNTANPTSGPDGDAAARGWDPATGWGEPDWFNFSIGYAMQLGATNLTAPASLNRHFSWGCAKTPSNSTERAITCPSTSTCFAVGSSSGGTPWYGKFLPSGAWGAVNTILKSTDGGQSWFPSNSDMFSIACTSSSTCLTVGAGGRERRTTDGGNTWADVPTAPGNNKPLTQVTCPSSSICYAVGDRGNVMKSTDGGQTWAWQFGATYGNPLYGLSCPSTTTCYATDIYAHVFKTTDGGTTWAAQTTPITTPYAPVVAETGGPNPWGGLTGISCSDASTCVGVGIYASVSGQTNPNTDPPIVTTTDGGQTWTRQASGAGTGNFLQAVSCLPGTTTCWAVGRAGKILTTTNLTTWTAQTSNTTSYLNSVLCLSTTFCIAVGQNGTVDTYDGTTWTATTGNGGTGTLADVACDGNLVCYATGKQGITLLTTTGGTSWTIQAGGGSQANQLNGISCTSTNACFAAGNAGQVLKTTNGGQSWLPQTSGTTSNLNAVSCFQANGCVAVGAVASGAAVVRFTNDGTNWNAGSNTGTQALNGISCVSGGACLAVGAAGTAISTTAGGGTWDPVPTGTTSALNSVACPSSVACYAVGAAGTILKFPNVGSGPSLLTSGTTNALNGIACVNATYCFASGVIGTTLATADGGATWGQQGNPISGPTSAINATNIALNGAACTTARCLVGLGVQGDILTTPLLTVTLHASGTYGTTPNLSGLPANNAAIAYDPSGQAANVTGTLTCSTTAVDSSPVGSYPVSNCSGLADDGFNIVYNYAGSSYSVTKAPLTVTADDQSRAFGAANPPLTATLSGFVLGQVLATSGVTGQASCTTTATTFSPGGGYPITCTQGTLDATNYSFGPFVPGTLTVTYTGGCLTGAVSKLVVGAGQSICLGPGATLNGGVTIAAGGSLDLEGATINGGLKSSGAGVIRICGSTVNGGIKITGSTGLVLIGGDAATGPCAGNTISGGSASIDSSGGVEFNGNTVSGGLTITGITGTLPPPDTGSVHATGNKVTGKSVVQS